MIKKKLSDLCSFLEQIVPYVPRILFIFACILVVFVFPTGAVFEMHNKTKTTFEINPYILLFLQKRILFTALTFFERGQNVLSHILLFFIFTNQGFDFKNEIKNPFLVCPHNLYQEKLIFLWKLRIQNL